MARARGGKSKRQFIIESIEPRVLLSKTIYVDVSATGATHDGTSWNSAFPDLQLGLAAAVAGDEIHVADGTYKPTSGTDRKISYQLKGGVKLFGGYEGAGAATPDNRNPGQYISKLSGDIGVFGTSTDNSYHVVVASGVDSTAALNGFTITGGYADGSIYVNNHAGAGMLISNGSPTIDNCVFIGNSANTVNDGEGGGIYNDGTAAPLVRNCTFEGNSSWNDGGAIYNEATSSPTITHCTFIRNWARYGGGVRNSASTATMTNCAFFGNGAQTGGGLADSGGLVLNQSIFVGNYAVGGAAIISADRQLTLLNCTLASNSAVKSGGAMSVTGFTTSLLRNCILWGNDAADNTQLCDSDQLTSSVFFSDVQGGWSGSGNIDANPQFVRDPSRGPDGIWGSADDDYGDVRLWACSPCTDAGQNAAVTVGTTADFASGNRFVDIPTQPDSGTGTAPIVDMGAYEAIPELSIGTSGPYKVITGREITMRGFGASDVAGSLQYDWEWSGDGLFDDATGPAPKFSAATVTPALVPVTLRVTDAAGRSLTSATTLRILPEVIYVDSNAPGAGDGSSWDDAFNSLGTALEAALPEQSIAIADGVYRPSESGDRTASFRIKSGMTLEGGYAGYGAANPDQQDFALYPTILSGDVGISGDSSDNSYHVVVADSVSNTTLILGLTIAGGNANGDAAQGFDCGGGFFCVLGSPQLVYCIFSSNSSTYGGGVYTSLGGTTVDRCAFSGNTASSAGGGFWSGHCTSSIVDSTFDNNSAGGLGGGGIYIQSDSSMSVARCAFTNNLTSHSAPGAGIQNYSSATSIVYCIFSGARISGSGAGISNNGSAVISHCTFRDNVAKGFGGGLSNGGGSPRIEYCDFSENTAHSGGGMYNHQNASPQIHNCTFVRNVSTGLNAGYGAGMFNDSVSPLITDCVFDSNSGGDGGGLYSKSSSGSIIHCSFTRNVSTANGNGGGLGASGTIKISNCSFVGNSAFYGGGASILGSVALTNCTFRQNMAVSRSGRGGGLQISDTASIINCVFTGNTSGWVGGAIKAGGTPTIKNCTIVGNSADTYGGAIYITFSSTVVISNSIVWGNTAPFKTEVYVDSSSSLAMSYSTIRGGWAGTGNLAVDPQFSDADGDDNVFGTSDDNPTLRTTSPCIDAGNNDAVPSGMTTDLIGSPRIVDVPGVRDPGAIVDMGAYERVTPFADGAFLVDAPKPSVKITFNSDVQVSSLSASDVLLINRDTGVPINCGTATIVSYDAVTRAATWQFLSILPDGNYRATLPAMNVLDTTGSPILTVDLVFDFFILAGDANRDRVVDIRDLSILAANWQGSGKVFSQGDFNYDGKVDAKDLGILSLRWQQNLPAPAAPAQPVSQPIAPRRTATRVATLVL